MDLAPNAAVSEIGPLNVGLFVWALAIAVIDARSRRIPNALLLLALVPALLCLLIEPVGLLGEGLRSSLLGLGIGFSLFMPGYWFRLVGAGDVKLAGVCGLMLGQDRMLQAIACVGLGMIAFALYLWWRFGWKQARSMRFPAGVAIAAGFVLAVFVPTSYW